MKKKKRQPEIQPKPPEFRSSPFSGLKEVALVTPQSPVSRIPASLSNRDRQAPSVATESESDLFLQAMGDVRQLDGRIAPLHGSKTTKTLPPSAPVKAGKIEIDRAEREAFNVAIGQLKLDVTFADGVPDEDELKPLAVNRLRQFKKGVITIDRQLDLHGLTRDEALAALPRFLRNARAHGEKAVLIITGKGNNSPAEPVLQQAVAGWLREQGKDVVVEFAPAPREMGGSGAFVVFLRAPVVPPDTATVIKSH